ncbi:MAG: DUF3343 domain-containing protein [Oscillospiraceae bacterium]|nr:DUF3343 domain-containing protein [Oscillospiraceae bacterium]MDD4546363.1 DUF3343 domain-containing protein [Oscillospiraceae bacterium]
MSSLCFYVSSITNAMRGKSILEQNGIRAFITRSSDETVKNGCGYCLLVTSDYELAERLLRSTGMRIRDKQIKNDGP